MENFDEPLDSRFVDNAPQRLELTEELVGYWSGIAGWTFFFSILSFLGSGISCFIALASYNLKFSITLYCFTVILLSMAILLLRFRSNLNKALYDDAAERLEMSFQALRRFYQLFGILIISATLLYASIVAISLYNATKAPKPEGLEGNY